MTAERPQLSAGIAALTGEVVSLNERLADTNESIDGLTASNEQLGQRSRKHSGWILATAVGLFLDLVLSVGLLLFYDQQSEILDRLGISVRESCNLYALFLGSYRPESRPPGPDRETYEANFVQLRESYRVLGCTERIVPPATQTPRPTAAPTPSR